MDLFAVVVLLLIVLLLAQLVDGPIRKGGDLPRPSPPGAAGQKK